MAGTLFSGFLEAVVRSATPLGFAAVGELVAERSGVINIGLEGSIACGALTAFVAAQAAGPEAGFIAGGLAGVGVALLFAFFVLALRAQQVVVGAAVSMLGLGLTSTLNRALVAGSASVGHVETLPNIRIPLFADIPVLGNALFSQPLSTYVLYLVFPLTWWMLYRTIGGLALRAVGERPAAAVAAGHSPVAIRFAAVLVCGFLAGLGGATLVVAQTGMFADGMSSGRGFVAIAIVALGRWTPAGVAVGALVFGAVSALQYLAQSMGWQVPYTLVLASPYVLTLAAMALVRDSRAAPLALSQPLESRS